MNDTRILNIALDILYEEGEWMTSRELVKKLKRKGIHIKSKSLIILIDQRAIKERDYRRREHYFYKGTWRR